MCKKEMTAVAFLEHRNRLCSTHMDCSDCALGRDNNERNISCKEFMCRYPEEAVAIVQKWAEGNPVKTIMSDFFEKYPNAPKLSNGAPETCPSKLGYDDRNGNCVCPKDCVECWSRPLEGN